MQSAQLAIFKNEDFFQAQCESLIHRQKKAGPRTFPFLAFQQLIFQKLQVCLLVSQALVGGQGLMKALNFGHAG